MTLKYLVVADAPFPSWDADLEADLTFIDKVNSADEWARIIFDHYEDADALITDLAPVWPEPGGAVAVSEFNGINALLGAKENALPSFVYTPFVSEYVVSAAYRAECNAVVHSYQYTVAELKEIIDRTMSKDASDPERIWIDTEHLPADTANMAIAATDETLSPLTAAETKLLLQLSLIHI